jgi:hypothetical protein
LFKTVKYTNFDQLPDHCLALLSDAEESNFFHGRGWFENFTKNTIDSKAEIHIYTVEDNTDTPNARAILFMRSSAGQTGSLFEKKYCGLNSVSSMTGHQTLFYAPAIRNNDSQLSEVISALVNSICKDKHSWGVIDLNFLNPESQLYTELTTSFKRYGLAVRNYHWRKCIHENVKETTYADYLAARSKAVKKTYAYKQRKLEKTGRTKFEIVTGGENLEQAIQDYEDVLAHSWKGTEPYPNHAAGLIRAAAKANTLRLGLYYIDGKPVATHLWIVTSGRATICKHHHNLEFNKESAGAILTLRMFEYAIDTEHVHTIDFGVGDEPAKRNWLNSEESLDGIVAFNYKTITGLASLILYTTSEKFNQLKQSVKPYLLPIKNKIIPEKK